jgi:hypothetical protein
MGVPGEYRVFLFSSKGISHIDIGYLVVNSKLAMVLCEFMRECMVETALRLSFDNVFLLHADVPYNRWDERCNGRIGTACGYSFLKCAPRFYNVRPCFFGIFRSNL